MAFLLPHILLPIGIISTVIGISITAAAVLRSRSLWVRFSLLDAWLLLFLILISQAFTQTIAEYLPITLLGFVMVLFAVELLTDDSLYQANSTTKIAKIFDTAPDEEVFRVSIQQAFRRVSRLGLLFASCYLASLGVIYLAALAPLTIPLIADISLYMVVVLVALALLILLREE